MNAARLAFRFRVLIFLALYILGFVSPWEHALTGSVNGTLWLTASTLLARTGWISLASATLLVTVTALACLLLGAILRIWGTAYLGAAVMQGGEMHGHRVTATGPYRYVRNPLYLGSYLLALGVSILMPLTGALFFIVATGIFILFLISSEERFLASQLGDAYQMYCRQVPRRLPKFRRTHASLDQSPEGVSHWLAAVLVEIYSIAITACFAILAWRYNAHILVRCVLICYGLSLVMRAIAKPPVASTEA
jgi:protein-S-isoprenylcysteine O-methyltransferase Ste14